MQIDSKRLKEKQDRQSFLYKLNQYRYLETLVLVFGYLLVGYLVNPDDICILHGKIAYILLVLSIITLFHGFESGMLAITVFAFSIYFGYDEFQYTQFFNAFMMTLIFGEFHYYWKRKLIKSKADTNYNALKLNELSRAFYSLKISHDQLEKNYVTRPMSLRNSMLDIKNLKGSKKEKFEEFLIILEKSFSVINADIVYDNKNALSIEDNNINIIASSDKNTKINLEDKLLEKCFNLQKPVFVSDEDIEKSDYLAIIPAINYNYMVALLLIKDIPFMSFNKENLTSIAILFEYFLDEMEKENFLAKRDEVRFIKDEDYRYDYLRMVDMYNLYNIDSSTIVIKTTNEITVKKLYPLIEKLLRSLDVVTLIQQKNTFYISILFPLADKSASDGFFHRLQLNAKSLNLDLKDIEHLTFSSKEIKTYTKYING